VVPRSAVLTKVCVEEYAQFGAGYQERRDETPNLRREPEEEAAIVYKII
jgi:hypothetical protein